MATAAQWSELEGLKDEWLATFNEPMPMGFMIQPQQLPILQSCLRTKSKEPLERHIESLDPDRVY